MVYLFGLEAIVDLFKWTSKFKLSS